jgi:NAD(P)-dependent dehydrogenase (short-subunit alcohol dehydrogenase family)
MVRDDGRMDLGVKGRTAVVTGASRGIGAAVAGALAAEGARVVRVSRGEGIDVTAADAAERVAALAGGPVDILVNNAGTSFARGLLELTDDDWRGQWELHVMGALRLMRHFAPLMAERGWGSIINIGSMAGSLGLSEGAAYGATKAAIASLTQAWAAEYSARGVRVNTVAPGPIYTRPEARDLFDALGATTAMKRAAQPEEIAEVVAFVASPAASYMTGATIAVDGGRTAI